MLAETINPNSIGGLADRVGVSFAISIALILVMVGIGRWLMKSVFDRLVNSHIDMMDHLKSCNTSNAENLQRLAKIEAVRLATDKRVQGQLLANTTMISERLDQLIFAINDQTERLEVPLNIRRSPLVQNLVNAGVKGGSKEKDAS